MKISVAMCTYNGEKYIRQQLDSIFNQTHAVDELVICDDCSKDATVEILTEYQKMYPATIKVYVNEKNLGYLANFEKAFSLVTGDIIFSSDQDDVWRSDKVEKIFSIFTERENVMYIFTNGRAIDAEGASLGFSIWDSHKFNHKKQEKFIHGLQKELLVKNTFITGATMAIRKDVLPYILSFPRYFYHDYWIVLVMSFLNDTAGYALDDTLIDYRNHSTQTCGYSSPGFIGRLKREIKKMSNINAYYTLNLAIYQFVKDLYGRIHKFENQVSHENIEFLMRYKQYWDEYIKIFTSSYFHRFCLVNKFLFKGYYFTFRDKCLFSYFKDLLLFSRVK